MDELNILQDTYQKLSSVDKPARKRILSWLNSKFEDRDFAEEGRESGEIRRLGNENIGSESTGLYETPEDTFPNIYANCGGSALEDIDKVILAVWFLTTGGEEHEQIDAKSEPRSTVTREITDLLHSVGIKLSNPTRTTTQMVKSNPQLLIQSRQDKKSHKSFRLAPAGWDRLVEIGAI